MRNVLSQLLALGPELAAYLLTVPILFPQNVYAASQTTIPSPNLDLSGLGRVAVAGAFESISIYSYSGQSETGFTTNGSQALLTRFPDGSFHTVDMADASIRAMCPFVLQDGTLAGVIVGGNFTSLGGVQASAIALWNPNTTEVTALPGLNGVVNALYCDASSGTVYVGGEFMAGNSTNAMAWTTGWTNLPFAGFNGPVYSIVKNEAGNIVFGGQFEGIGNSTQPVSLNSEQVVPVGSGNITSAGTTSESGFNNPASIICNTGAQDGPGSTWLLNDDTGGWWEGSYAFGFIPTKFRLYNTQYQGRGAKTFYFEELNSGGILNLSYADASGKPQSCIQDCPLAANTSAQEFTFSPAVGMSAFRIYITSWYGAGGGLSGIEMFQSDIYSYAVTEFNEPKCDDVSLGSASYAYPSGLWTRVNTTDNGGSNYLSAYLQNSSQIGPSTSIVFQPNLKESGNYSISVITPGCIEDNTCSSRGQVNITGSFAAGQAPTQTTLYQTNNYVKIDQVYYGYVDAGTGSFRPSVTLSPMSGQSEPLTVVAQRVRFDLITSTGGLNGLFEYNPNLATVSMDFANSTIDAAGAKLSAGAIVKDLAVSGNTLYVAGNFSGDGSLNFMSVAGNTTAVAGGGLNGPAMTLYQNGSSLWIGGNFTASADGSTTGLDHIAVYSTSANSWSPLGAGVNDAVDSIVPLPLNITDNDLEQCVAISGNFTTVNAFSGHSAFSANGLAVWVPSKNNWLNNINGTDIKIQGDLTAFTTIPGMPSLWAGMALVRDVGLSGAVELMGSGLPSLEPLGIQLQAPIASSNSSSSTHKRDLSIPGRAVQNYTGVYDGLFYGNNGFNITVLGGSFSANATNGSIIENLAFINNTNGQSISGVSGLSSDSIFTALATQDTTLFAGGDVAGSFDGNTIRGLIAYNLATNTYVSPAPPALGGNTVSVNAIAPQPSSNAVYVGGDFETAGALPCATLCFWDTSTSQWNTPGNGLGGIINTMVWSSSTQLLIAGNLTLSNNATSMVSYDAKAQTFSEYTAASTLPGPITALTAGNGFSEFWAAGIVSSNNSVYLSKFSGSGWTAASGLGNGSTIRGLQLISLTSNHASSTLVEADEVLMISGNLNVPGFGNASAVLFNGTTYEPFLLTNARDGSQGSLSGIFVENTGALMNNRSHHLALGLVVLVGLAIALGLIFLMVCAGILLERSRRRKEGYVRMPNPAGTDPRTNVQRINPASLFAGLGEKGKTPAL